MNQRTKVSYRGNSQTFCYFICKYKFSGQLYGIQVIELCLSCLGLSKYFSSDRSTQHSVFVHIISAECFYSDIQ